MTASDLCSSRRKLLLVGGHPHMRRPRYLICICWRLKKCRSICERWSRFPEQNGGLAKMDSGFDYAANFSWFACVA
jgi:hypothetical protein